MGDQLSILDSDKESPAAAGAICENRIDPKLLSVKDLALKLNVSAKTIYGWIYRGEIKPIKVGPRLVRFNPKEVEQWISNQGDS